MTQRERRPRVFISHASTDTWVAAQIDGHVQRCGAESFLVAVHRARPRGRGCLERSEIRFGQLWDEQVRTALAKADVFVLVVSPDYFTSNWSMVEMGAALARAREGAIVVPVTTGPVELPAAVRAFRAIDARSTTPAEIAGQIREITSID